MTKVLLVGCGNMGFAMLSGWLDSGRLDAAEVSVIEPDGKLRQRAQTKGVAVFAGVEQIPADVAPRLVVMAVKPQIMPEILPAYRRFADRGAAFLSIAAGTRMALFETLLGHKVAVIRCMPNTPASIGEGMMVTVANSRVDSGLAAFAEDLLSANGAVATVADEGLMDAVTAVSGSGPAYVFHFIEALTHAAVVAGLPQELAELLARQTVVGAASLVGKSAGSPETLRRQVTSPNGTTAAALDVLMGEDRLKNLLADAVDAARRRSIELG